MFEKLKEKLRNFKNSVFGFCKEHPDIVLTVVGGAASLTGACIKMHAQKTEYQDYVYTVTNEHEIYKIPAKELKTANMICSNSPKNLEDE